MESQELANAEDDKESIIEYGPLFEKNAKVRDMSIHELKKEYRKEQHYFYWLRGFTYAEISQMTGWKRNTIWEDLKEMRAQQMVDSANVDVIRDEALTNLLFDRAVALRMADSNPKHASKFLGQVIDIDKLVLTRYTQPKNENTQAVNNMEKKMKWMIDYMVEKMGAEVMDDFGDYMRIKEQAEKNLR